MGKGIQRERKKYGFKKAHNTNTTKHEKKTIESIVTDGCITSRGSIITTQVQCMPWVHYHRVEVGFL